MCVCVCVRVCWVRKARQYRVPYLDVAVDDVRAVHVLEAGEYLVQEQLHVLVCQELRRPDQLVEIGIDKLKDLSNYKRGEVTQRRERGARGIERARRQEVFTSRSSCCPFLLCTRSWQLHRQGGLCGCFSGHQEASGVGTDNDRFAWYRRMSCLGDLWRDYDENTCCSPEHHGSHTVWEKTKMGCPRRGDQVDWSKKTE